MTILYGVHVIIIVSKYNGGFAGAQHSHGTTIQKSARSRIRSNCIEATIIIVVAK